MVKLQSTTKVAAPLEVVWVYFSKLQNMVEWDPTIKSVKELQRTPQIINSTYEITSKWEGEEEVSKFQIIDFLQYYKIVLKGGNSDWESVEEMYFRSEGETTEIQYKSDVNLKGLASLGAVFFNDAVKEMAEASEKGMRKKCEELFGVL